MPRSVLPHKVDLDSIPPVIGFRRGFPTGSVVDSGSDSEKGRPMSESSDSDCDFGGGGFLDLMDECDEVKLICMLGYID